MSDTTMSDTTDTITLLDDAKRRQMELRGARDELVDLLGIGETLPLQDVVVRDDRLTVPFEAVGTIPIDPGQADARYDLRDSNHVIVSAASSVGTGGLTYLTTPTITNDVTFEVVATKLYTGRTVVLHESAAVKVGLDLFLAARILADPLDSRLDAPADGHPRIVDWASPVEVEIDDAQEGVSYRLVDLTDVELVDADGNELIDVSGVELETISENDAQGLGVDRSIVLHVAAVREDVLIGIVATKVFDPSTGIETRVELLDLKLPLKVRAAPALTATLEPVVDDGGDAVVTLAGSQASTRYQLYARPLDDPDFLYGDVAETDVLRVAVDGEEDAQVPVPPWAHHWVRPQGFIAVGDPRTGTDGDLQVVFPAVEEDHLVIVQARKEHALDVGDATAGTIASEIQLEPLLLLLARPQHEPDLSLLVAVSESTGAPAGTIEVVGGQPGVFYQFLDDAGNALGLPAYVHQLDEIGKPPGEMNKGLGQLRMELDFAVARDQVSSGHRGYVAPSPPMVEIAGLASDSTLGVRAKRARTRLTADLAGTASIPAPPVIRFEEDTVTAGSVGRIQVIASLDGERYEPFLGGEVVKQARWGNGGDLVFLTGAVSETTTFEVHVTRPNDAGLAVTRIVPLTLTVEG